MNKKTQGYVRVELLDPQPDGKKCEISGSEIQLDLSYLVTERNIDEVNTIFYKIL